MKFLLTIVFLFMLVTETILLAVLLPIKTILIGLTYVLCLGLDSIDWLLYTFKKTSVKIVQKIASRAQKS